MDVFNKNMRLKLHSFTDSELRLMSLEMRTGHELEKYYDCIALSAKLFLSERNVVHLVAICFSDS